MFVFHIRQINFSVEVFWFNSCVADVLVLRISQMPSGVHEIGVAPDGRCLFGVLWYFFIATDEERTVYKARIRKSSGYSQDDAVAEAQATFACALHVVHHPNASLELRDKIVRGEPPEQCHLDSILQIFNAKLVIYHPTEGAMDLNDIDPDRIEVLGMKPNLAYAILKRTNNGTEH